MALLEAAHGEQVLVPRVAAETEYGERYRRRRQPRQRQLVLRRVGLLEKC